MTESIIIYTDGNGNGACGFCIPSLEVKHARRINVGSRNEAEYWGIIDAIRWLRISEYKSAIIRSDSELAVRQINRDYQTKGAKLVELGDIVLNLIYGYDIVFEHISGANNPAGKVIRRMI